MAWQTTARIDDATFRIYERLDAIYPEVGVATVNTYLVEGRKRAALIDSGMGIADVRPVIAALTSLPCVVLNTHYHWDHVGANGLFAETAIHELEGELLAQEQEIDDVREAFRLAADRGLLPQLFEPDKYRIVPPRPARLLRDGEVIDLGERVLRALHTPGHSPGSICYLDEDAGLLFTGDTAYIGPVFACFEGSDPAAFARSAAKLAALPGSVIVCPGHNDIVADRGWLGKYARCVGDAVSGRAEPTEGQGPFNGQEFRFGKLSVWLKE